MTAEAPATAKLSVTRHKLPLARLHLTAAQGRLVRFLLLYRWASLLPALWLWSTADLTSDFSSLLLFTIAVGSTLLVTTFSRALNPSFLEIGCFLGVDILWMTALLALSGDTNSPYYWHALNPLLLGTLLFQRRGVWLTATAFTFLYLLCLWLVSNTYPVRVALDQLVTQLVGMWLIPLLFNYPLILLRQSQQSQEELTTAQDKLVQQHTTLTNTHHQLEIIHDLTLLLQGASDIQSVQQRVLRAVSEELGYSQAIVGLVNSVTQSLGDWQAQPPADNLLAAINPLPLTQESGLIARQLLERRGGWWVNEEPLVNAESLNVWFSQTPWLILPLALPEHLVGVLLVAVEGGPGSLSEDQLVILTAVASQAATALGTIERARRLAAEQERNRIARDIHDTVAQSLFGIVFTLDACIKMLPDQTEQVKQELVDLRDVADQVRREIRRYILDTWPSALTQEQFRVDLTKYVAHCAPAHAFHLDLTVNGDFDRLPSVIRRSLYRVSQEALANVARHAGVDAARLTMHVEPDEVYLSISDRGKGFDPKMALAREYNRERFGLRGICERVEALGGTCDILSQMGHGTQVLVRVPITRRRDHD
jgi:signal transduction histidine kinase